MTIWHFVPSLTRGTSRSIASLAHEQVRAGHHVRLVTAGEIGVASFDDRDFDANLAAARAISSIAGPERPHVVHTHGAVATLIARLYAGAHGLDLPIVTTIHGWDASRTPGEAAWDVGLASLADRVAVPSTHLAQVLAARGLAWAKLCVVPYGTSLDGHDGPSREDHALDAKLADARAEGSIVIGCPGAMGAAESHGVVLDSLERLGGNSGVLAVFSGDGDATAMRRLADDTDGAAFQVVGAPVGARWFAARADAVVLPAMDADHPIWVLECFEAGVIVIAAEGPGVRELVEDGATGLTFPEDDAGGLASALARLRALPAASRDDLRRRASARHARHYTAAAMARHCEQLYLLTLRARTATAGRRARPAA